MRRFLVVGSLCVAVDAAAYYALVSAAGWSVGVAKAASYLAGVAVGFVLNKRWTFESARPAAGEAAAYLTLYAATLAVNVGCNRAVLALLGVGWRAAAFLFATGVTTVLNFLGMRLVTFRRGIAERRDTRGDAQVSVNQSSHALTIRRAG